MGCPTSDYHHVPERKPARSKTGPKFHVGQWVYLKYWGRVAQVEKYYHSVKDDGKYYYFLLGWWMSIREDGIRQLRLDEIR